MIESVVSLFKSDTQTALAIIDKLLQLRVITPLIVAKWVFSQSAQVESCVPPFLWKLLFTCLQYATFMVCPEKMKVVGETYEAASSDVPLESDMMEMSSSSTGNKEPREENKSNCRELQLVIKATLNGFVTVLKERLESLYGSETNLESNIDINAVLGHFKKVADISVPAPLSLPPRI